MKNTFAALVVDEPKYHNHTHILYLCYVLGAFCSVTFLLGMFGRSQVAMDDGLNNSIVIGALYCSYISITYALNHSPDADYNYGYNRVTVLATFVNTVYILFYFIFSTTHVIHEVIEGFYDHQAEEKTHHGTSKAAGIVMIVVLLRILTYLAFLFVTLKSTPFFSEFKPIVKYLSSRFNEPIREEESDDGDLANSPKSLPLTTDEDDHEFYSDSILYFSIKVLIVYELCLSLGQIWSTYVTTHFGILQHLLVFAIILSLTLTIIPVFMQTSYVLMQKNFPRTQMLKTTMKEITYVEGVKEVIKDQVWTIDGSSRVGNLRL